MVLGELIGEHIQEVLMLACLFVLTLTSIKMTNVVCFVALQVGDAGGCTAGRWRESDGRGT